MQKKPTLILCPVRKAQGHNCALSQLSNAFPIAWHPAAGCSTIANASHVCSSPNAGCSSLSSLNCARVQSNSPAHAQYPDVFIAVCVIYFLEMWLSKILNNCFVLIQVSISFRAKFDRLTVGADLWILSHYFQMMLLRFVNSKPLPAMSLIL